MVRVGRCVCMCACSGTCATDAGSSPFVVSAVPCHRTAYTSLWLFLGPASTHSVMTQMCGQTDIHIRDLCQCSVAASCHLLEQSNQF